MSRSSANLHHEQSDWIFGGSLLLIVFFLSASWNVAQAITVKEYSDKNKMMMIVFFFTLFVTIQSAMFSLVLEKNLKAWRIKSSIEMISILFTAILGSMYRIAVHSYIVPRQERADFCGDVQAVRNSHLYHHVNLVPW
ncbi:hypothetical protein ACFE04_009598 [Oxalis oulophora]